MKKLYVIALMAVLSTVALKSSAQDGFNDLLRSNSADATLLFKNYANPLFKGFGTGLNSGWNNTAATKKLLHFDLRITANAALVPTIDKTFDVTKIGLSNRVRVDGTSTTNIAQTFGGDKDVKTPVMALYDNNNTKLGTFTMPDAVLSVIPAPNVQLTVGLIKNTDVTFRITPDIKLGDEAGKVGMFGIGFKHNIIKDFVKTSTFDLAVAVNYSRISYSKELNVANEDGTSNASNNQRIDAKFSGVNVQAILSKKLLFFTPFVAVAYQTAKTDFGVLGKYVVKSGGVPSGLPPPANPITYTYTTLTDPVHINENSVTGLRADVGFQLNLAVFRIYASGSLGEYKSVNGGIGLGF
jgi:hypothetical protein